MPKKEKKRRMKRRLRMQEKRLPKKLGMQLTIALMMASFTKSGVITVKDNSLMGCRLLKTTLAVLIIIFSTDIHLESTTRSMLTTAINISDRKRISQILNPVLHQPTSFQQLEINQKPSPTSQLVLLKMLQ